MKKSLKDLLKSSTILQLYARAAAPCRDYHILSVGDSHICLNSWKITHSPHVSPKEKIVSLEDFKIDKIFQEEIKSLFGVSVHDYIHCLSHKIRKLENVPTKIFMKILNYLNLNDVFRLSYCSRILFELCNTEEVWKVIFYKKLKRKPSPEETRMAIDGGYKEVLKRRLAYILRAFKEKETAIKNKGQAKSVKILNPVVPNRKKMIYTK